MLHPVKPLQRNSISGQRRVSGGDRGAQMSLLSRRCERSHSETSSPLTAKVSISASPVATGEQQQRRSEHPTTLKGALLPNLRSCPGEAYKVSGLGDVWSAQQPTTAASSAVIRTADANVETALECRDAECYRGRAARSPGAPPTAVERPPYLHHQAPSREDQQKACMPSSAQKLFTSTEVEALRREALCTYRHRQRLTEQKDFLNAEAEARRLLDTAAADQHAALRQLEKEEREMLMRAASTAALPVQYLEQRIQRRIQDEYRTANAQLCQEGREAWRLEVAAKAAAVETGEHEAVRRAASHRFRAALTFVIVQEAEMRKSVEVEEVSHREPFEAEDAAGKAEAERLALERFLNTPEQLAIAAEREKNERKQARRTAKLRKLFVDQQMEFVGKCRHGNGGASLFSGEAAKKVCGRCRVKWDDDLGYFVSMDRAVKVHPPPPSRPMSTAGTGSNTSTSAASTTGPKASIARIKPDSMLPPMTKKVSRK